MDMLALFYLILLICSAQFITFLVAQSTLPLPLSSRLTVVGAVYCDPCFTTPFPRYGYFMPGVEVHIQCRFNVNVPKTTETISISVNRSTDLNGVYRLEIPSVDGVDCIDGPPIQSFCQATLLGSSSTVCNVPVLKTTTDEISVKSKSQNQCVYCFSPLSFRPTRRNDSLCRQRAHKLSNSASHSRFLLPPNYP